MTAVAEGPERCRECGLELSPTLLACPRCQALVHSDRLKALVHAADVARSGGDWGAALSSLRSAQELLPTASKQHAVLNDRIIALNALRETRGDVSVGAGTSKPTGAASAVAGMTGFALLAWKLKAIALFALGPLKILMLGLTKFSTVVSMALAFGVYWAVFGWRFALGLIVTTYVHEMGHVVALRNRGMAATAPMFIPGVGAFVRLKHRPVDVEEDAAIGLAGPLYGAAAASVAFAIGALGGGAAWLATARVAAWINLFNLLPIGSLDGGRALRALGRDGRLIIAATFFGAAWWAHDAIAGLAGVVTLARAFESRAPEKSAQSALVVMFALVVILGMLAGIRVPGVTPTP